MSFYGVWETWKIVYTPNILNGGIVHVAFVEAGDHHHAMHTFMEEYKGEYGAVLKCEKLIK